MFKWVRKVHVVQHHQVLPLPKSHIRLVGTTLHYGSSHRLRGFAHKSLIPLDAEASHRSYPCCENASNFLFQSFPHAVCSRPKITRANASTFHMQVCSFHICMKHQKTKICFDRFDSVTETEINVKNLLLINWPFQSSPYFHRKGTFVSVWHTI